MWGFFVLFLQSFCSFELFTRRGTGSFSEEKLISAPPSSVTLLRLRMQVKCSTASARRTTDTRCQPPRGTAPRAWRRFPPSPLLRSPRPLRLTSQVLRPHPSPTPPPRPPGLWSRARASVLLREPPRPPRPTAPSALPPASAGESGSRWCRNRGAECRQASQGRAVGRGVLSRGHGSRGGRWLRLLSSGLGHHGLVRRPAPRPPAAWGKGGLGIV